MNLQQTMMTVGLLVGAHSLAACGSQADDVGEASLPISGQAAGGNATGSFQQTNLVSDQVGALILDPMLVNAWGISSNPAGGTFGVSANGSGVSELYAGDVNGSSIAKTPLVIQVPGGAPTGQVFNGSADFVVSSGAAAAPARVIFATQTGTLAGWAPAVSVTTAQMAVSMPGAVYTGLTIANGGSGNLLYVADHQSGKIDVFNSVFKLVTLAGSFTDPGLSASDRPFNIQNLGGRLYVSYAAHRKHGEGFVHGGSGAGAVSVFDTNGHWLQRIASGHPLKAPWGMALAPADFGPFGGALLVGNFGDGRISAFDSLTGAFLGQLRGGAGGPIAVDGLFGLAFGNGLSAGDSNALYFAAGPEGMTHGLFGSIRFLPQP